MRTVVILAVTVAWLRSGVCGETGFSLTTYSGMCDASAAVALDADRFVAANDEDSVLRVYRRSSPGMPESTLDLTTFLEVTAKRPETDLEGATKVGNRIYWITSHGRNAEGKKSPNRQRFFATEIVATNGRLDLVPVGKPYRHLLADMLEEPAFQRFNLKTASELAPKEKGALNIEALCAAPDGRLLIGFRNPIPDGKALLVPLMNPDELIRGQAARLGNPILIDLGGLGIRAMEFNAREFIIVAGSYHSGGKSRVYSWRGGDEKPVLLEGIDLAGLNPEGLFFPDASHPAECEFISDDGTTMIGDKECKKLSDPTQRHFRVVHVQLPGR